ncbi:MAG: hydantoinase/carbamoylase family amidase [Chloroflexota bacterium]|nr:hydantoinase/carbamoylase family amidase [Chloroflexota bacterium]
MNQAGAPGTDQASRLIDPQRLWDRHMQLAEIGATPAGGVNRPALSDVEIDARGTLLAWARRAGLTASHDPIANLFLRLEGSDPGAAPVLAGSHIDSQPTGGKFDGAFGVLAALEALTAMSARGLRPRRSIEVVAWTNEEGSRFAPGLMGSEAFAGLRPLEKILAVTDAEGETVRESVARVLAADAGVESRPLGFPVHAFIEPHIEQGTILERADVPIGVVTGMQGSRRFRVTVSGNASHAGTTPRAERRDAVLAAARMINDLVELMAEPEDVMFTVGLLNVRPNAPSVVPEEAYFSIDLRHPANAVLAGLGDAIAGCCDHASDPCAVAVREIASTPSIEFPGSIRRRLSSAADRLGLARRNVYSLAGHDARNLHAVCRSGMIFVPCRDGISHNESEWAEPAHLVAGTRVLADALWGLANDG